MFTLTENQIKQIDAWKKTHICTCTDTGAIGGKYTYNFTPTGLGIIETVTCACNEQLNVTDYNW